MKINIDKSLGLDNVSVATLKALLKGSSLTASDIAKMIDYPRTTILYKLHQLKKRGMTESMRSGKERFWNITDDYKKTMHTINLAKNIASTLTTLDSIAITLNHMMKDKASLPKSFPEKSVTAYLESLRNLKM